LQRKKPFQIIQHSSKTKKYIFASSSVNGEINTRDTAFIVPIKRSKRLLTIETETVNQDTVFLEPVSHATHVSTKRHNYMNTI
jgi:hypothetical protein